MSIKREFFEVISELSSRGVLKYLVLTGSWVLEVYRESYGYDLSELVTKDIDLLVKTPRGPFPPGTQRIDRILKEKGYKAEQSVISGFEKYIPDKTVKDNELDIEFLCQPGRHVQDAFVVKELGIVVQPLQYQEVLLRNTLTLKYKGIPIEVPDPAVWAIHKIAVSQMRTGRNSEKKRENDLTVAGPVVEHLGEDEILNRAGQFKGKFLKYFNKGWEEYKELHFDFSLEM